MFYEFFCIIAFNYYMDYRSVIAQTNMFIDTKMYENHGERKTSIRGMAYHFLKGKSLCRGLSYFLHPWRGISSFKGKISMCRTFVFPPFVKRCIIFQRKITMCGHYVFSKERNTSICGQAYHLEKAYGRHCITSAT